MKVKASSMSGEVSFTINEREALILYNMSDSYTALAQMLFKEVSARFSAVGISQVEMETFLLTLHNEMCTTMARFKAARDVFEGRAVAARPPANPPGFVDS